MKSKLQSLFIGLALIAGLNQALGQSIVINSFSQNGVLVCSGLQTGTVASVQWASLLSGPWQTNWAGLTGLAVSNNGTIRVSVPMTNKLSTFFRVLGVSATNATPPAVPSGMALIPAGSFTMGDNSDGDSDAPVTNVYVSSFYMDTNLVSYSLWVNVSSYATAHGYSFVNAGAGKNSASNQPVQSVDWYDGVKWCNARSQQAGLTPVYYTDAGLTQIYTNGEVTVYANWSAKGYRLPTEAEWEKAARGGLRGQRFPWGNTISESQANYYGYISGYNYDLGPNGYNETYGTGGYPYTSLVGSFAPNGYGLYDMAGNVIEWCWDWYGTPYAGGTNPQGPSTGSLRVIRGGSWNGYAFNCRSAHRAYDDPTFDGYDYGFRSVLPAGQ